MKIWGYWTTLGWSIVAFLTGQFVGFGVLLWLRGGDLDSVLQTPFDGVLVTIFTALSNPVTIGALAIAVWLARSDLSDYFALKWPIAHDLTFGIAALVVLIAAGDALLYLSGRDLVTRVPAAILYDRGRGGLASGDVCSHDCDRSCRRRGCVPRLSVSRLGAVRRARYGRQSL